MHINYLPKNALKTLNNAFFSIVKPFWFQYTIDSYILSKCSNLFKRVYLISTAKNQKRTSVSNPYLTE